MRRWVLVLLAVVLGGGACIGAASDAVVGARQEALTAGQVNALNNVGRSTGITYGLTNPPEPDMPVLSLSFAPISDLRRVSEYTGGGGLTAVLESHPSDPGSEEQALDLSVYPPDPGAPAMATFTTYPPDPGAPARAVCDASAGALSARLSASAVQPPDPEVQPPDPEVQPPDPERLALTASMGGAPFVEVFVQPPDPERPAAPARFVLRAGGYTIEGWQQPPDPERPAGASSFRVIDAAGETAFESGATCGAAECDVAPH